MLWVCHVVCCIAVQWCMIHMCVTLEMADVSQKLGLREGSYNMHAWLLSDIPLDMLA